MKKRIAILGSTGSIGTQALEVIRAHSGLFEAEVLTAHSNAQLLIEQALEFNPNAVVIGNDNLYKSVCDALIPRGIKVFAGKESLTQITSLDSIDMILNALVGFSGMEPTVAAINAGKDIALANKESLVVAGNLITSLLRTKDVLLLPVDSEHSAIFQCLVGEQFNKPEKIYLTASGGPFRGLQPADLERVTKEQALKHPNWSMGCKITIDSATLMNKGLEVIEAHWLFNLSAAQIEVLVHPQSIIHSMVLFADGSVKAQLGQPDMRLPIQYALSYPFRLPSRHPVTDFIKNSPLTFEKPDPIAFRSLVLCYQALETGGNMPCILNAANEIAVNAFLNDKIGFTEMSRLIEKCMQNGHFIANPTLDDYISTDNETRRIALEYLNR
ncbi:MAG TPA: 1-deoxy-D-xylulose-5-phosphate reductoisomerase [Bacteroidales bacterium]|nr:1-deoxy-D-xylulose-5-phosphate reductoisomerase [Bacteroidales bacterium]